MISFDRGEVKDHDCETIVLTQGKNPRHFGFSIRNSLLLLADCLDALRQDKQGLVDARRLHHSLLAISSSSIVFRSCQINGASRADSGLAWAGHSHFDTQNGM